VNNNKKFKPIEKDLKMSDPFPDWGQRYMKKLVFPNASNEKMFFYRGKVGNILEIARLGLG